MARTPEGEALTEQYRALQIRMNATLTKGLAVLWRTVSPADIRGTLEPFAASGEVITLGARRANALAAQEYYSSFRAAEGLAGRFVARLALDPPAGVLRGALFGAAARGLIDARKRGLSVGQAAEAAFARTAGAATQIMANGGRETLLAAIASDPEAQGYQRVTDGDPCAFCRMLASRGIVAYTAETASFKSHGGCGCTAEPAFEGSRVSPRNATYKAEWDQATGTKSGADALSAYRAFVAAQRKPATG